MKEKLTLRNVVIWGAAFLGVLFFFLSFAAKSYMNIVDGGYAFSYRFCNAFWNGSRIEVYTNGMYISELPLVGKPFALPIIGLILLLLTSIGSVVISLVLKDEKIKKFVLIGAGVLAVVGGVFIFFGGETGPRTYIYAETNGQGLNDVKHWENALRAEGFTWGLRPLGVIIGVFAILVGGAFAASPFLPEKKLLK